MTFNVFALCWPNTLVGGTAQKQRFWVSSLRSAAPHLGRYAFLGPDYTMGEARCAVSAGR